MTIKAVIFDFGGVLVQTINHSGREKWEQRLNLLPKELSKAVFDSDVAIKATIGEVEEDEIWKSLAQRYQLNPQELAELHNDFWSGDWLDPELVEFLSDLRPQFKTAILSNAWSGARDLFTGKFNLDKAVDLIIISSEVGLAKPDPKIYALIAEKLNVQPGEAVFVDDTLENVVAARQAGLVGIQFQNTQQVISELKQLLHLS